MQQSKNPLQVIEGNELKHEIEWVTDKIFLVKTYTKVDGKIASTFFIEGVGETGTFTDIACCGDTEHGNLKMEISNIFDLMRERPDDFQISEIID